MCKWFYVQMRLRSWIWAHARIVIHTYYSTKHFFLLLTFLRFAASFYGWWCSNGCWMLVAMMLLCFHFVCDPNVCKILFHLLPFPLRVSVAVDLRVACILSFDFFISKCIRTFLLCLKQQFLSLRTEYDAVQKSSDW